MTTHTRHHQPRIDRNLHTYDNITPSGDHLIPRTDTDTYIRIGYQNIHGTSRETHIPSEITAMQELGLDLMGMSETNRPWNAKNKTEYNLVMKEMFRVSRTIYSSAPASSDSNYQPGGTLLTINGHTTGRVSSHGTDPWGRFCWYRLRGRRDEGLVIICAYRVCHAQSHNPGPLTAYQQQYTLMREAGVVSPNPRKRLLTDLTKLIDLHRKEGFRPLLMIDANGDYHAQKAPDRDLEKFLRDTQLQDPFYDKFQSSPRTYVYGKKRLDYIFTDAICAPAIKRIGYLGTHQGAPSDHCLTYVDLDEQILFQGILNRPVPHHSREITLSQDDKVLEFIQALEEQLTSHKIQHKVFDLTQRFTQHGATDRNITRYHTVYTTFLDLARATAKKVGRKKFGYMRSTELTTKGRTLLAYKFMLDCKRRHAQLSPALVQICESLSLDHQTIYNTSTESTLRTEVRQRRQELWDTQKNCENLRKEWLITIAKDRARATDDPDWERKMKNMIRTAKECAVNRKLTMVTKGTGGVLDRIQIPSHEWFYSPKYDELYHYDQGNFEAFPSTGEATFFTHHTLKVLPPDVELVKVELHATPPRWHIIEYLPRPPTFWEDVTSQQDIEQHLLRRNRRHLEQTDREQGPSTHALLTDIRANHGFNPLTADLKDGTFDTTYELTPAMSTFFELLRHTPETRALNPILGCITSDQFQTMFQLAREKTSSDSRTLNYSLWKCIAKSDYISSFAAILLSLPFMYGFVNTHWTHMSDFMLEKKPGVRQLHLLRIIGKVPAEYNTCLKFFIGHQAMHNFESTDTCDFQHGFRPHRSSVDAAMLKLLTFECSRLQRSTVGMIQHDMAAHFDRMYPEMTSIYASRYGVSENILTSIGQTIQQLKRNVETSLGLSEATYQQEEDAPRLGGMVQGKADVPQLSTQQSDILLQAHKKLTHGLVLHNPSGQKTITHHSVAFADDTDQHTNTPTSDDDAVAQVVDQLTHSGQTWNDLITIPGGLLAYHKCNWQLIAWRQKSGHMELIHNHPHTLTIKDRKGASSTIDYVPPDKPNIGLGFHLCPNGNQRPQLEATLAKLHNTCARLASTNLTESETRQLLRQRILPQLTYVLHLTSFSPTDCRRIDTLFRTFILPRQRLNRHYPGAVLYGPSEYGGMEFPHTHTLQTITQIKYIVKQLRWNKTVANDMIVTLDTLQLVAGFHQPLLEYPLPRVDYIGPSLFLTMRSNLARLDASLWIEDVWRPQLQREYDAFIMDRFILIPRITPSELKQANAVRLYMRILTIADITDPSGCYIPSGMLTGEWQAGSDLHWPHQPMPPKAFWATFRKCIRYTFCTHLPPRQHISDSMDLDTPLGKWLPVHRHTWFTVYRSAQHVYWRTDAGILRLKPSNIRGFYIEDCPVDSLPLETHPIIYKQTERSIWTHRQYRMSTAAEPPSPPPGLITNDTLHTSSRALLIGSDASLHSSSGVMTSAYMITQDVEHYLMACCDLSSLSSHTSYRGELEGIYRALVHTTSLPIPHPTDVAVWCDNKAAIDKNTTPLYTPGAMLQPEADILLATAATLTLLPDTTVTFHHVYGHQDTRTRPQDNDLPSPSSVAHDPPDFDEPFDAPHPATPTRTQGLTRAALVNVACDTLANETAQHILTQDSPPEHSILQPPYKGSRALLKITGSWITGKMEKHITHAAHRTRIRDYCSRKYNWSEQIMDSISWDTIRRARAQITPTEFMHTSKVLHGWLPVMHMHGHVTGNFQCPGCECDDETIDHLLRCPNPRMLEIRESGLRKLTQFCTDKRVPPTFQHSFLHFITSTFNKDSRTPITRISLDVYASQSRIGSIMMLRGFWSKKWITLLKDCGAPHADRLAAQLLRTLWSHIITPLWHARNNILHDNPNFHTALTNSELGDRLLWYLAHKDSLSRRDQFLARYTAADVERMTPNIRREWTRHLDTARDAWTLEQTTIASGQRLITHYFART